MISLRPFSSTRWLSLCLALAFVPLAVSAEEGEKRKKGLKRLVPTPFKKDAEDPKKAVEDMREFTASLPGAGDPKKKPAVPATVKPLPASEKVEKVAEPTPKPEPSSAPEVKGKKGRRGFFRKAFGGDGKEETKVADKPAPAPDMKTKPEPEVKKEADSASTGRKKLIKIPFVGGKDDESKPEVVKAEKPASADVDAEKPAEAKVEKEKNKRTPLLRFPFGGDKADKVVADVPAPIEPAEPSVEEKKGMGLPKLRLPFGKDEEKAEKKEVEIVEAPKKEKAPKKDKRGLFGLRGDLDAKKPAPAHAPSSRDLGTGEKYVVTVGGTPFYSIGPSQPLPPDEILGKGKLITMRKAGWGWSDIELPGGQMGVVATKNLRKATAAEMGGSFASRGAGRSSSRGLFKALSFDPMPEPDLPTDAGGMPLGAGLLPPLNPDD